MRGLLADMGEGDGGGGIESNHKYDTSAVHYQACFYQLHYFVQKIWQRWRPKPLLELWDPFCNQVSQMCNKTGGGMTSTFAEYVLFQFEVCLEDLSTLFRVPTVSK